MPGLTSQAGSKSQLYAGGDCCGTSWADTGAASITDAAAQNINLHLITYPLPTDCGNALLMHRQTLNAVHPSGCLGEFAPEIGVCDVDQVKGPLPGCLPPKFGHPELSDHIIHIV